jgi:hypothetical protein
MWKDHGEVIEKDACEIREKDINEVTMLFSCSGKWKESGKYQQRKR